MRKLSLYIFSIFIILIFYGYMVFLKKISYKADLFNVSSDAIAVLTGGKGRIKLGLELYNNKKDLLLIISGVDKKVSEKTIIPLNLQDKANITIDKEAESTYQNAIVIKKWIKKNRLKKITIITSYYHMPRSMFLVKALSPDAYFYPYPVKKSMLDKNSFKENIFYYFFITEEYIKYLMSHFILLIK